MAFNLENLLKDSSGCGWKQTLARMVGSFDDTPRANEEEKKDGMDPNDNGDGLEIKERLGGWL